MSETALDRREELERETQRLRARERSLQSLAQSAHCGSRPEAELELGRVRQALSALYVQMRQLGPHPMDHR